MNCELSAYRALVLYLCGTRAEHILPKPSMPFCDHTTVAKLNSPITTLFKASYFVKSLKKRVKKYDKKDLKILFQESYVEFHEVCSHSCSQYGLSRGSAGFRWSMWALRWSVQALRWSEWCHTRGMQSGT